MNILVTGANGQLGNEIRILSKSAPDTFNFIFSDICSHPSKETEILDITCAEAVNKFVSDNNINCIVNCAAYTNVDKAESDAENAYRINAYAPKILATAMKNANGLLIHISTDYVFGQESYNVPCTEQMEGSPSGVYGASKLEGEINIEETGCRHIILRTSWLYSEFGKNFMLTMVHLTGTLPVINVVFDQVGTPTYAYDLATAIFEMLKRWQPAIDNTESTCGLPQGIYNYSNEGACSWYDFAHEIARISSHTTCSINPCHSSEFPSPVKRPSYSVLDKTKIKKDLGISIPHWTESLSKCMSNLGLAKK